ncbi:threonine/serine exporter family protein [Glutamicibacter sp. PS]|uniref:threonine/serine ThrE exporter family protein n=1 Tax=Glutamicibacter TaxID=1742989 RepID=UPI002852196B|nr:threonine/serine exporter family protein [Glutamicibacter sp. PS]MDR4533848.1 threonine/serine exporter family protein [Glutamicibacter sp. PS]
MAQQQSDEPEGQVEQSAGQDPAPAVSALPLVTTNQINVNVGSQEPDPEPAPEPVRASALPPTTALSATLTTADADDAGSWLGQMSITDEGVTVYPQRANPVARRLLAKIWVSDAPPTQALNLVDRLQGTPYANPKVNEEHDASTRRTIEFALDLGETLIRYGAGALEVETSVIAVTAALGVSHLDMDTTNQSLHLNYSPPDAESFSVLRVVRSSTANYAGLVLLHELVSDIIAGGVSRQTAVSRLKKIQRQPKPFPRWLVATGRSVFAAAFVLFIGGTWLGALIAMASSVLVSEIGKYGSRWRVPEFFTISASSFAVTAIALLGFQANAPLDPALVVSGGILLLLPSGKFVSALQDAINGFPVTAIGRLFSAGLTYMAIVVGISAALVVFSLFDASAVDVHEIKTIDYPIWFMALLVVIAIIAGAVTEQTARRLLLPTAGIALLGYLVFVVMEAVGMGERGTPAVVSTVIGFAARYLTDRLNSPQLVLAAPAVMFMLPGLMIFRAMYVIVFETTNMSGGLVEMFNALGIMLAIAGGVVLGDTLCRPLTSSARRERRRIRRR